MTYPPSGERPGPHPEQYGQGQPHGPGPQDASQPYGANFPGGQGQPPYGYQPAGYGNYGPPPNPEKNGFGLTALILGIVGLLFCLVPLTGFIGFICGVIALIFGIAGISRVRKSKATNKKTSIAGTILGALAIAGGIWGMVIVFTAVDQLGTDLNNIGDDFENYSNCIENADTPEEISACD